MRTPRAQAHLETLGGLTCNLMNLSSTSDDASVTEALDHLLESWSTMAVDLQMKEQDQAMLQVLTP